MKFYPESYITVHFRVVAGALQIDQGNDCIVIDVQDIKGLRKALKKVAKKAQKAA